MKQLRLFNIGRGEKKNVLTIFLDKNFRTNDLRMNLWLP